MFFEMPLAELWGEILSAMEDNLVGDDQGAVCHYWSSACGESQGLRWSPDECCYS